MIGLLAEASRDRLCAIRDVPITAELPFALRRVLYTDRDAEVRAAAARRLGDLDDIDAAWLSDALGDRSPLVRDAVLRSLAKRGGSRTAIRALTRDDRTWWVRRTAVYALAAIGGADEIATLAAALADPFWRVRHAAVQVLAALGARDLDVRAQVIATPPTSTLAFLRAAWGPVAVEAPQRAHAPSLLPAELLDADPAVVTARLASSNVSPLALVELLCDPHAPLRLLAAERIAASGDRAAYAAALDWLEEPRIPHVADTVEHLLDRLGDPAAELAAAALARVDRPGGARWAIAWVVATRFEELYAAAITRAETDPSLRSGALRIATDTELAAWIDDELVDAIAVELHERHAHAALLALDASRHPRARALQIDAAAQRDEWPLVEAALADPHHGPRAVATRWLVRARRIEGVAELADPDPSVREAAMSAKHAVAMIDDRDPWVARAAIERLAAAWHDRDAIPAEVAAAIPRALGSPDPWLRMTACRLPITELARVVELLGDPEEMVRSAALDALERGTQIDARLAALLATADLSERARAFAHAWVHGETLAPLVAKPVQRARITTPRAVADVADRRRFGRAGFTVSPLAISGAFDLSPRSLEHAVDAGVDLLFWEPSYDRLTRFLRDRNAARVIAGSYHADAASIEADVDRALRRLDRDTLDVFLLFWSRSPARVDAAAYAMLERIRRAGKIRAIGFSTHHRDVARIAIETSPWDVVMIRHSAAHPGIETELLPTARERDTAIITFSALCYGRMVSGPGAPSPADCYRYSLSQPGVTACISAPRRRRELLANLDVLRQTTLPAERLAALREHGVGVRAENQRFNTLLRQPTRDAATAARELLAAELPPSEAIEQRRLPRASAPRGRTTLGSTRRGRR